MGWKRWDAKAEKTPIVPEDSSGRSLDGVISVPANFYDYYGVGSQLTDGVLDQDMVADNKRSQRKITEKQETSYLPWIGKGDKVNNRLQRYG